MRAGIAGVLLMASLTMTHADQYVQGHLRSNGTYVHGYNRSTPNDYKFDNYSTKGNTNPWTGEQGKIRSEFGSRSIYDNDSNRTYRRGYDGYRR